MCSVFACHPGHHKGPLSQLSHLLNLTSRLWKCAPSTESAPAVMERYNESGFLNVGTGDDVTIRELASTMARVVGFKGESVFDSSKPDGTPRKVLDVSKVKSLGWEPLISLEVCLRLSYE
jgi:nucleoside-diphosphate-sugar epimerase